MSITPLQITASSLVNAMGYGKQATLQALRDGASGLRACEFPGVEFETWTGQVEGLQDQALAPPWSGYDCRNNRLVKAGLDNDGFYQAVEVAKNRYGAHRIGLFLGTSTSGSGQTELAYQQRSRKSGRLAENFDLLKTHNTNSLLVFARLYLGLEGPGLTIATACSSSAKVFAAASRYIEAGWCDAAIVGGVDSLCLTTLYGFNSLELVSKQPCRPWDKDRNGINVGEAAGFALLEKNRQDGGIALLGYGESSDAYHMSTPHPHGEGAVLAMRQALGSAGLQASQIDYVNVHGTATRSNDAAEDRAMVSVFGTQTACSSSKGWTGHTLGASGITEAIIAGMAIEHGFMPMSLNLQRQDPALASMLLTENTQQPLTYAMSNSFGFGGTNCSLVLGRTP